MKNELWRVIAYDIADPKRLRRIETLVKRFAERVQDSVYEAPLSDRQVARLLERARELMDAHEDTLRVDTLCAACRLRRLRLGNGPEASGELVVV